MITEMERTALIQHVLHASAERRVIVEKCVISLATHHSLLPRKLDI
jgi:hypothetical protein